VSELTVWRICAARWAENAFDGEGARRFGGRWSSRGTPLVYCSESRALAMLEVLAHVDAPELLARTEWVLVSAGVPGNLLERPASFPVNWRDFPAPAATRRFGDDWADGGSSAALRVPSAVVPGEFNYLLNPLHPEFARITRGRPEPFAFDSRLA
jgi:RES domain-containing protein